MRAIARALLYLVPTLMLAVALYGGWVLFVAVVLGQTECDRGECSAIGEFAWNARWFLLAICVLIAGAIVWSVRRLIRRGLRRPVRRAKSKPR